MRPMRRRVFEDDVAHWAATFLGVLDRAPDTWPAGRASRSLRGARAASPKFPLISL